MSPNQREWIEEALRIAERATKERRDPTDDELSGLNRMIVRGVKRGGNEAYVELCLLGHAAATLKLVCGSSAKGIAAAVAEARRRARN